MSTLAQKVSRTVRDPHFRLAAVDMAGTSLGIAAWGLVTGVAMVKSGMSVSLALFMSLVVYAGSAQLAVIPLLTVGAPLWVIWLTASCVNLRFVIFSSMWRSYFAHRPLRERLAIGYFSGDVIYVAFMKRFPEPRPQPEQMPYFWGRPPPTGSPGRCRPSPASCWPMPCRCPGAWALRVCWRCWACCCRCCSTGPPGWPPAWRPRPPWPPLHCRSSSTSWWPLRLPWRWG